jgi:O-antigen/teichoic acid export membrane protein
MALVSVVMAGINLFSDIGIGAALIQSDRDDRAFTDTMWTILILRSLLLWGVASAIAGPVADFYEEPVLESLLQVASFGFVISGLRSTNFFSENRNLRLKRIVSLEISSQLLGVAVMITWAVISPSVWALVAGGLVTSVSSTILSHVWLPGRRNRLHFEREAAVSLYRFGRWILLSTLLTYLAGNAEKLVFGKLVSMATLGVYNIALNLAVMPSRAMRRVSMSVIFPLYSRFHHAGAEMLPVFRNARLPILALGGWATAGMVAGGPTIIEILYDPRYIEAGWMLQVLVAGMWFGVVLEGTNGTAVLALGHSRWIAIASGTKVLGMVVLIPVGWHFWSFKGALLGFAASDFLRYLVSVVGVLAVGLDGRAQDFKLTALVFGSAAAAWLVVQKLETAGVSHLGIHACVIALVVTAAWFPQLRLLWQRYKDTGHLFFTDAV